ncbi:hypothetical protein GQ457_06G039790 [Hibiscus cannabinus]
MSSSSFGVDNPPLFDGQNYQLWAVKMKAYLRGSDLWDVVETGNDPPPLRNNPTVAQMKHHAEECAKKFKALSIIHAAVTETIFTRIMACETGKEAWDRLRDEFQGSEKTKQMQVLNIRREYEMLRMKESESVKEYADRLMKIVNQIRLFGEDLPEKRVVEKVLVSLPEKFEAKISSLEDSKDISQLSLAELVNSLQAVEQRKAYRLEEPSEVAFLAKQRGKAEAAFGGKKPTGERKDKVKKGDYENKNKGRKGKFQTCSHCNKKGHSENYCWFRPGVQCRSCKQFGHVEKVCKAKTEQQPQQAQVAENLTLEEEIAFMALQHEECCVAANKLEAWLIDSGCTHHMTPHLDLFKVLDKSYKSRVKIGDGSFVEVKGKGDAAVETSSGTKIISDVLFVPEISQSLLSVGQLLEKNYNLHFHDRVCDVFDKNGVKMLTVKMIERSFPIKWKQTEVQAFTSIADQSSLWHRRLGHFNYSSLKYMSSKGLVKDMPVVCENTTVCEVCQKGKQTKLSFPVNQAWRASEKLQLVHTDLCGPMRISSLNGSRYFLIFIDDFSRWCWVFFLKQKSEVFDVFQSFKANSENQSGKKIKTLRSDNGSKYTSRQFASYLKKLGIHHQLTVVYTPQQNGVSERKNRTVLNMARCLLFEKKIPKGFWAEAVNTSVYLLNRLPTKALEGKTPFEAWFDATPSIGHLRVFGCVCYMHVPEVKRDKLDERATVGVFMGYSSNSKGYRVYDLKTKKILVGRNLKFDEDSIWDWNKSVIEHSKQIVNVSSSQEQDATTFEVDIDSDEEIGVRGTRTWDDIINRCNVAILEPTSYQEAAKFVEWKEAMQEEIRMISKNDTWKLVDKPKNKKVIGVKWVYRVKLNSDGSINKHKARFVVKGYSQEFGVDFTETFAHVARFDTIRLLIALAAHKSWEIYQLDVKSAFLNGYLQEEIFIEQPEGFVKKGCDDKVYLLKKTLYGLKQAPRAWYNRIDEYLTRLGFVKSCTEATPYVKEAKGDIIVVSLYVDDLLVTDSNQLLIRQFKEEMKKGFEMNDLGKMSYFLGMEILQLQQGIFICQRKYAIEVLKKFRMENCKTVSTPAVQDTDD